MEKFYKLSQSITARKDLLASDKIILAIIQNYERLNGNARPSMITLESKSGLSKPTVLKSIKHLETSGLLEVDRRGTGKSNHYKSGKESLPVKEFDQSENFTTTGKESLPEPVKELYCIRLRHIKTTGETSNFAFVLKNESNYKLPQTKLEEYESTYPEIDIAGEFAKAAQWLRDNPGKRKTEKGMPRFLNSWLARAKPQAGSENHYQMRTPSEEELEELLQKC